jgi:two-component system response regulator AtoC
VGVIAATHRDLAAKISDGTFREDLLYRLDALRFRVPPLRERRDDIEPLAVRFLRQAHKRWQTPATGFQPDALSVLLDFCWPGNVRQLKNVVERAAAICTQQNVGLDDLPEEVVEQVHTLLEPTESIATAPTELAGHSNEVDIAKSLSSRVRAFEARLIREALATYGGNHTKTAAARRIPRRTLSHRISVLGIG